MPEMISIKTGSLDGEPQGWRGNIDAEAYAERRLTHQEPIVGANQVEGMIQQWGLVCRK